MKKFRNIEISIIAIIGILSVVYWVFYADPAFLTETTSNEYAAAQIKFHPFWNLKFIKLYQILYPLVIILSFQAFVFTEYKKLGKTIAFVLAVIVSLAFIYLEVQYNHKIDVQILSSINETRPDLNVFFGLIHLPLNPEYLLELTILNSIHFIVITLTLTATYFIIRQLLTVHWESCKKFLDQNRTELLYIVICCFMLAIGFVVYNFKEIAFIAKNLIIQLLSMVIVLSSCISFNVFWVYTKNKSVKLNIRIVYALVFHLYMGSLMASIIFVMIHISPPSLGFRASLQFLMIAFGFSGITYVSSNIFGALYYLLRKKEILKNAELLRQVNINSAELSLLKSQINPHFLFNSLNTVYGLALEEESPKSAEGVQKLSDMMRFMLLENTADKIPLDREIKYIHDYIDFQLLRIDNKENIDLIIDIADGCKGQIAPMLLIPMIENAFKHGISMNASSWAKIKLTCDGNDVTLNVKNSMHPKTNRKEEESGIGLENVRKRLAILYPEKHLFQLFENEEQFEANIKVTLS